MKPADNLTRYTHGLGARILHWGFVGIFAYALYKQLDAVEQLEDHALLHFEMIFAACFIAFLVFRFLYMRRVGPTSLPEDAPRKLRKMARAGHLAMYFSLSMIAVSGLLIGALFASGIKSGPSMEMVIGAHEFFVGISYVLIIGHVAAAIYHRRKSDGVWSSMVPFWKESR